MDANLKSLLAGDRKTIARLISEVEDYPEKARDIVNSILPHTGRAHIIGITGPPGCGKSTLVEKLALEIMRKRKKKVGIIAVDPSSPFSGGAFMGNRIRMREASMDTKIFIRSMASRGSLGGLSRASSAAVKILEAAGMDYVIIETVGAGQMQTDIARTAYTIVVVVQPEIGDMIQAMKSGLMEIGDIFAVNKVDLPGADKTVNDLVQMLSLGHYKGWKPKITPTIATKGKGITGLARAIEEHRKFLVSSGAILNKQKEIARREVERIIEEELRMLVLRKLAKGRIEQIIGDVAAKKLSAYDAAKELMGR